jgi:hypothetical protein
MDSKPLTILPGQALDAHFDCRVVPARTYKSLVNRQPDSKCLHLPSHSHGRKKGVTILEVTFVCWMGLWTPASRCKQQTFVANNYLSPWEHGARWSTVLIGAKFKFATEFCIENSNRNRKLFAQANREQKEWEGMTGMVQTLPEKTKPWCLLSALNRILLILQMNGQATAASYHQNLTCISHPPEKLTLRH